MKCRQLSKASKLLIFASTQNSTNGGSRDSDVKEFAVIPIRSPSLSKCGDDRDAGRKTPYGVPVFSLIDAHEASYRISAWAARPRGEPILVDWNAVRNVPLGVGREISEPGDLGRFQVIVQNLRQRVEWLSPKTAERTETEFGQIFSGGGQAVPETIHIVDHPKINFCSPRH